MYVYIPNNYNMIRLQKYKTYPINYLKFLYLKYCDKMYPICCSGVEEIVPACTLVVQS
jgi:hypothetical protein